MNDQQNPAANNPTPNLSGKVALVTGGAVGIGAHYAKALAGAGARVIVADIVDASAVLKELKAIECAPECTAIKTDVSDEDSVRSLIEQTLKITGRIDILINNAALYSSLPPVKCTDIDLALWDKVQAVNVRGVFLMVKHVAPTMIAQNYGKIINIGSGVAYKGMPDMLHYATSKGAVITLTRALSRELGEHNICVNTLSPGLILSDSILANEDHLKLYREPVLKSRALKRDAFPDDLIGGLLFLASSDSDFYTGQNLAIDGGSINT